MSTATRRSPDRSPGADPRTPAVYRAGLSSARQALRAGAARRHRSEVADGGTTVADPTLADSTVTDPTVAGPQVAVPPVAPADGTTEPGDAATPVGPIERAGAAPPAAVRAARAAEPDDLETQQAGVRAALAELRHHRGPGDDAVRASPIGS